ncbi:MAG: phosphotransferase, partial [Dehalococcoidales bacterium]|nr:phosphotransferase [Dehalococcoidales bacterium]
MTGLPKIISALLKPEAYPEATDQVELVQTQMSFVFLADKYVYKVKKPVNLGYLDYTTLESRRFYCHREVELNQRLCPDIYHGVAAITRHGDSYRLGGQGRPIEYAVKMSRLPQDKMMDVLLRENQVSTEMIGLLAEKLADFHRQAETSPEISAFGRLAVIRQNTEENFSQTEQYIGKAISRLQHRRIRDYMRNFIEDNAALFEERVAGGRIRDCHGDLHTAHVCFKDGICIYDCIEFNDRFRYGDVASEVAFLVMDLDHHGRADLGRSFVNAYRKLSQDEELKKLLNFYRSYRAYVRGKVACFKLDDPHISEEEKERALTSARQYFELAES